jgi:hypothetical protein
MKASELRIGNWLLYNNNYHFQIAEIQQGPRGSFVNFDLDLSSDYLKPIPLTPEILEKAGFVKDNEFLNDTYFTQYLVQLNDRFGISNYQDGWYCRDIMPNLEIEYLHQLQNLYFALTGEELTIDLS